MITVTYREPGDFLSDEKPGEVKTYSTAAESAQPYIEDGWLMVRIHGGRVIFGVQAHKVLEIKGDV